IYRGRYHWLAGAPARAYAAWRKAAAAAERLGMAYDEGLAHYELGRHSVGPERKAHLERACTLFGRLGTTHHLERAQAALGCKEPDTAAQMVSSRQPTMDDRR